VAVLLLAIGTSFLESPTAVPVPLAWVTPGPEAGLSCPRQGVAPYEIPTHPWATDRIDSRYRYRAAIGPRSLRGVRRRRQQAGRT